MNRKVTTKTERQLQVVRDKKIGKLLIWIGVLAFIAFVYSLREYNRTFIQFKYILFAIFISGFTIGTLSLKYSRRTNGAEFSIWRHYLWASFVYGSLLCGLFFWTNTNLSKAATYDTKTQILGRFDALGRSARHVTVEIDRLEKDIPMPNSEMSELNNSNFVILTLIKGFWGFPYIVDKKLSVD